MSCTSPDPPDYCSAESPELKLYQAFIFSVPVFFTFVLLLFFYLFYLRRSRANWQSLRMRTNNLIRGDNTRVSQPSCSSDKLVGFSKFVGMLRMLNILSVLCSKSAFIAGVWFKEGDAGNVASGYLQREFLDQGDTVSDLLLNS